MAATARKSALSPETKRRLATRAEASTGRQVAAEAIALELLDRPVQNATKRLALRLAFGGAEGDALRRAALQGITAESQTLTTEFATAGLSARDYARQLSRGQVSEELAEGVAALDELAAVRPAARALPRIVPSPAGVAQDTLRAQAAAQAMSSRWASQHFAAVQSWHQRGQSGVQLGKTLGDAGEQSRRVVRLHAIDAAVEAFSDEHGSAWRGVLHAARAGEPARDREKDPPLPREHEWLPDRGDMLPSGPEQGLPYGWSTGFFDVWTALLDRKTCPRCWDADGHMVPVGKEFPGVGRPPIHRCCRCQCITMYIPEADAKRMPGVQIDYAQLKEDIRDYMRGMKLDPGIGRRHAPGYIREVIGDGTTAGLPSPKVLTKRLYDRDYFDKRPRPKAPPLPPPLPPATRDAQNRERAVKRQVTTAKRKLTEEVAARTKAEARADREAAAKAAEKEARERAERELAEAKRKEREAREKLEQERRRAAEETARRAAEAEAARKRVEELERRRKAAEEALAKLEAERAQARADREAKRRAEAEAAARRSKGGKPEHDPAHWAARYRAGESSLAKDYGDAATSVGWGRAMLERGLDRPAREVLSELQRLKDAGHPALATASFRWLLVTNQSKPLRQVLASLGAEERALVAISEHTRTITKGSVAIDAPVARAGQAKRWYDLMLDKSVARPHASLAFDVEQGARAGYTPAKHRITLSPLSPHSEIVHEFAHAIETADEGALRRSLAFKYQRTEQGLEQYRLLSDFGPHYGANEVTQPDKFIDPYIGKTYGNIGTEVTSMGYEKLSLRYGLQSLAEKDPDMLFFCLGQLAGR